MEKYRNIIHLDYRKTVTRFSFQTKNKTYIVLELNFKYLFHL